MKSYKCSNKDCPQGARGEPSFFSGGMSAAQKTMLTGEPEENLKEGTDYGEGICPTCGKKGTADSEDRTPMVGKDGE